MHRRAQVGVLAGLLRGDDIDALLVAVAPSRVPGWFTPDVARLELAVTALDLASLAEVPPLEQEGIRERYLPEARLHRGGVQPDLLNDAGWWNTTLWIYAVYAVVIYTPAAADRGGMTVGRVVREIVARHGLADDVDQSVRPDAHNSPWARHLRPLRMPRTGAGLDSAEVSGRVTTGGAGTGLTRGREGTHKRQPAPNLISTAASRSASFGASVDVPLGGTREDDSHDRR